jgi:ClpP class serine protease
MGIAQRRISDPSALLAAPSERRESGKVRMRDGVAVISVMGPIFPRADLFTEISGATSIETLALRFGEAVRADDVRAIVLHIDSPGGEITGVHEFAGQIYAARNVKPVVAYVSGLGASAAYWLAGAAERVVADETAMLGSIGVVAAWTDDKKARESKGLTDYEFVSSQSPNKRLDPAGEEGRAALQRLLDDTADIFIADVARNRGKRVATVTEQFGRGGLLLAAEAVKVGMADTIGSLEGVIAELSGAVGTPRKNRDGYTALMNKEIVMDKAELAAKYPDLFAAIQAEAAETARKESDAATAETVKAETARLLALTETVCGKESADKLRALLAAEVTPEQLAAVSAALGAPSPGNGQAPDAKTTESSTREKMLAAITQGTGGPLSSGGDVKNRKSALIADAERRASAQRTV